MPLTQQQVDVVLDALLNQIDDNLYGAVKSVLSGYCAPLPVAGDPYSNIKDYSARLLSVLQQLDRGIVQSNPLDETMMVMMEKNKIKRLLNHVPDGGYLAALPGIHKNAAGAEEFTVSLLAFDASSRILSDHTGGNLCGEEMWDKRNSFNTINTVLP
jgi:hypothetical protein